MLKPVLENPWVRAAGIVFALLIMCLLVYLLSPILVALFLALLVAYILDPVVDFFERRRVPRAATIAGLAVLGLAVLVSIPLFVLPSLVAQADDLIQSATAMIKGEAERPEGILALWFERAMGWLPLDRLVQKLGWVEPGVEDFDAPAILMMKIGSYVKEHALQWLKMFGPQIALAGKEAGLSLAQALRSVGRGVVDFLILLGNVAVFAFVAGYLLKDFDGIVAAAKDLVPPRYRPATSDIATKIDAQLRGFLRGQFTVCLCLGMMYAVGLLIAGVPFAILIAAFGMVAGFVPYLGLLLTIGPALVLALFQHGIDWHIAVVIATFAVAQLIEGTLLTPKIVGDQVGLGPVWVILAVMVFGSALGFLGLLLAVPIAATLKVLVVEGVTYYKGSPLFEGDDSGGGSAGRLS